MIKTVKRKFNDIFRFFSAEALLKYETLDADDIKSIIEQKRPPTSKLSQASSLLGLKPALANQLPPVATIPGLGVSPIPNNETLGSRKEAGPV